MTTPVSAASTHPSPRRRSRWVHWVLILFAAMTVVAVVEAASLFRLSRQAGEVRDVIDRVVKGETSTQVQFSVGPGALGLVRFVAGFVDDVPPEALRAMEAVSSASVGVYRLREAPSPAERIDMMNATARSMTDEGWYRVVAVHDGDDLVMIFAPEEGLGVDDLHFCVVVCNQTDLVVVSANADAGPLRDIAAMHSAEWRKSLHRAGRDVL